MNKKHFYYGVMALFAVEIAALALHADRLLSAPVIFWVLIGPAVFRAARTVSFNAVGAPIRERFTVVEPDGSGAGDTVNPAKMENGQDNPLGELLCCPICTGTHAAAAILAIYGLLPAAGLALVALLGVAGINEALHWTVEVAEWTAHRQREETGKIVRQRESQARAVELDKAIVKRYTADVQRDMESMLFTGVQPWTTEWTTERKDNGHE